MEQKQSAEMAEAELQQQIQAKSGQMQRDKEAAFRRDALLAASAGVGGAMMARPDFTRATCLTPEIEAAIDDSFEYHPWNAEQIENGVLVRQVLADAVKIIVDTVPPGPDRTTAIRKIREARMDANSAITHGGRY